MITIDIKADPTKLQKQLAAFTKTQMKSVIAKATTDTALRAVDDLKKAMKTVFENPTPWTLKAFYVEPATPDKLQAIVHIKEGDSEGINQARFLSPEADGGPRNMKRSEKSLGHFYVPSRGAIMDQYGNMSRGQIIQMMSRLGAFEEKGYRANMTDKSRAALIKVNEKTGKAAMVVARGRRADYFIAKSKKDGRPLGIYRFVSRGVVQPVVIFLQKAPTYQPRFHFEQIVAESINKNYERKLAKAMEKVAKEGFEWK